MTPGSDPQPNALFIITDQHRADCLGCYGDERICTPNIDRRAAEGVRVDRAYVTNPLRMTTARATRGHGEEDPWSAVMSSEESNVYICICSRNAMVPRRQVWSSNVVCDSIPLVQSRPRIQW